MPRCGGLAVVVICFGRRDLPAALLLLAADLDAAVSELVDRAVLPDSVKVRPPSWEGLLRCVVSLPSRDQRVLVEQTRRAEDERVRKLNTSNLFGARGAMIVSRRAKAAASAEADAECQRWIDDLEVLARCPSRYVRVDVMYCNITSTFTPSTRYQDIYICIYVYHIQRHCIRTVGSSILLMTTIKNRTPSVLQSMACSRV